MQDEGVRDRIRQAEEFLDPSKDPSLPPYYPIHVASRANLGFRKAIRMLEAIDQI